MSIIKTECISVFLEAAFDFIVCKLCVVVYIALFDLFEDFRAVSDIGVIGNTLGENSPLGFRDVSEFHKNITCLFLGFVVESHAAHARFDLLKL